MIEPFRFSGGRRGALLLVHGFTGSPYEMLELGESLASAGYSVLGVRLPGHGNPSDSDEPNENSAWRAEVARGISRLKAEEPDLPLGAVGLSMGALLVLDAVARSVAGFRAIACLSPALELTAMPARMIWIAEKAQVLPWVASHRLPKGASDIRDDDARVRHPQSSPFPVAAVLSFNQLRIAVRELLPRVASPLLVVHARGDRTCALAGAEILAAEARSPVIEKHVLEASGHVITVDAERAQVFELVREFFDRWLEPSRPQAARVS